MEADEHWSRDSGCRGIGSDIGTFNHLSHGVHAALGFEDVEPIVIFRKPLTPQC